MQGIYTIRSRITGATEFSATNPIVNFDEFSVQLGTGLNLPPSFTARIIGWAYNSQGAAHNALLTLRPPSNVVPNADDQIVLQTMTAQNNFTQACGPDGIVVPREFGIAASNQQPPTSTILTAATYRVFFSTTGKVDAGTFFLWYRIAEESQ
jgi:hypothetical protein